MKTIIHTFGIIAATASLTFGQDQPPRGPGGPGAPGGPRGPRPAPEEVFKKLDTSGDGTISLDEFKAGPMAQKNPQKAEEIFAKIDIDSNGSVTLEEFKAHRPERRPGQGPGKRKGRPEGAPEPPADAE
jgi:hypothetical protein